MGSGGLRGVFSSKLLPVDCKTDWEINGDLLEYGIKFPQKLENYNNYSPSIFAFFRASRGRIWTKIDGNESQRLPGPAYPPQNPQC